MIDLHAHVLPAVDDGPCELDEALRICRDAAGDGVRIIVATPHFFCGIGTEDLGLVRKAVDLLRTAIEQQGIACRLQYAAEVRLVEDLLDRIKQHKIPFYDDQRRYLLLETPPVGDVSDLLKHLVFQLRLRGMVPLIAHPERVEMFLYQPALIEQIVRQGAVMQLTADSLLINRSSDNPALEWIRRGWVGVVASDMHGLHRPANMGAAYRAVCRCFDETTAQRLFAGNPRRILDGERLPEMGT